MDFSGNLSFGPVTIPFRLVAVAVCLLAAVMASRIPLARRRLLRARVTELVTNAVAIFVVAWKLTPAAANPASLIRDPLPLLMASPGTLGIAVGAGAASAYAAIVLLRRRRLRRAALLPLLIFVGVGAAGVGVAELAFSVARPRRLAPELSLPTLNGPTASLGALRGRVVVVNFWATWCPPCRAEIPELAGFAREQGSTGAVLIAVNLTSTEKTEDAVRAFIDERELGFVVALDRSGAAARAWDVGVVPTTFVIAPDGRIAAERTGAVDAAWLRRVTMAAARRRAPPRARRRTSPHRRRS